MDLDGDGLTDVLTGSWPGELYLFRRLPSTPSPDQTPSDLRLSPSFASAEKLKHSDGKAINVGNASTAFAVDWDGDGASDLLVGSITGEVFFIPNGGSRTFLAFGDPQTLQSDGVPIKVPHGDSQPVAADWDGDGKLDLIVGCGDGSVLLYRNLGTDEHPQLAAARVVVPPSPLIETAEPEPTIPNAPRQEPEPGTRDSTADCRRGYRAKVCVTDWNGDGPLDLLVGDAGEPFVDRPDLTETEKAAVEHARNNLPELIKAWSAALAEYREKQKPTEGEDGANHKERERRAAACLETVNELKRDIAAAQSTLNAAQPQRQLHGRVWLFLRKD